MESLCYYCYYTWIETLLVKINAIFHYKGITICKTWKTVINTHKKYPYYQLKRNVSANQWHWQTLEILIIPYGYIINHKYNSNIGFLDSSEDYYQNSKQLNLKKSGTDT